VTSYNEAVTFGDVEVIYGGAIEIVGEWHGSCEWVTYDEIWVTCKKTLVEAKGISNEERKFDEMKLTQQ
jgi:hypothetical protein